VIQSTQVSPGAWVKIAEGPHALFWALGHIRISFGNDAPDDDYTSLHMTANGQVRSFHYNGTEGVWVMPIERVVHLQHVAITASELFLLDAAGNVVVDAAGGARP